MHTELRRRIAAAVDDPRGYAAIRGVTLHAERAPGALTSALFHPTLYMVVQGAKRLVMGDQEILYGGGELVLLRIDVPAFVQVTEASEDVPYLAVEIALDREVLGALAAGMAPVSREDRRVVSVHPLPSPVLEPTLRLLRLMDDPTDARVLADAAKREILYRVLKSPGGDSLLQLAQADSVLTRIGRATEWMHDHLEAPLRIDHLTSRAGMSVTSFHRNFKSATGTTPGQYHKMLRMHEARRLVALRSDTLARIAAMVGYASASHFSRDYKRAFGSPPMTDAKRFA